MVSQLFYLLPQKFHNLHHFFQYLQQVDDPPYLSVGTAVSAKYKGAFCEAKVSKVVRIVKCKVRPNKGSSHLSLF